MDRSKEFVNDTLKTWCRENGIDIQLTAPYSPSQNGVAERMNRTIVELARAMINKRDLPHFLWELAVSHAVYLRNRSYSKPLDKTPYEIWKKKKPNVAHLREFGAPVWVLLQGKKEQRKILPKSK
jgi:transposase InsO family protein